MTLEDTIDFDLDYPDLPGDVDLQEIVARGRRRRRWRRGGGATLGLVVVLVAVGGAVDLQRSPSPSLGTLPAGQTVTISESRTGTQPVPCETPTRPVRGFVDWPCPATTTSRYYVARFAQLRAEYQSRSEQRVHKVGARYSEKEPTHVHIRILAFGPLPDGPPGATLSVAEVWQNFGSLPVQVYTDVANRHEDEGGAGGPSTNADTKLYSAAITVSPNCGAHPASRCSETVIAGPGVDAVQLDRGAGNLDPPVKVHNRFATVAATDIDFLHHPHWTIDALNRTGAVIDSIPYADAL